MTDNDYTAIQIVVDRSGSMIAIKDDAQGALLAFCKDQANFPGRATVRLSQFDTEYNTVYPSTLVAAVPFYELQPRGGTALNDAIGRAIQEFGAELAGLHEHERPGHVIFVIITDGMENSSHEYTQAQVKTLVERQQKEWNWKFVFLAANQDAVLTGAGYGFNRPQTMTFAPNSRGTFRAGAAMSAYTSAVRSGHDTAEFSEAERKAALQDAEKED